LADDITLPLMVALERLSPLERAAFLLHDVFGMGFDDGANTIGREAVACRQLASRATAGVSGILCTAEGVGESQLLARIRQRVR
jgi:DNA-directed RNA polymerase specialized sigma24 family protein